jgi:hypothetical protein
MKRPWQKWEPGRYWAFTHAEWVSILSTRWKGSRHNYQQSNRLLTAGIDGNNPSSVGGLIALLVLRHAIKQKLQEFIF